MFAEMQIGSHANCKQNKPGDVGATVNGNEHYLNRNMTLFVSRYGNWMCTMTKMQNVSNAMFHKCLAIKN